MTAAVDLVAEIAALEAHIAYMRMQRDGIGGGYDPKRLSRHALSVSRVDVDLARYRKLSNAIEIDESRLATLRRKLDKIHAAARPEFTAADLADALVVRRDGLRPERVLKVNKTTVTVPDAFDVGSTRVPIRKIVAAWRADGSPILAGGAA